VGERADAPLLVAHQQQRGLGEVLRARGQGAQHAEGEHVAALHVHGARADQAVAVAVQRTVVGVRDDRVDVAEEEDALRAGPGHAEEEVGRVVRRRAREVLDRGLVGRQRGGDRRGLLGAVDVAARRGDGDERLELALGAAGDRVGVGGDPVAHCGRG
jgi:hypothetical protein